MSILSENIEPGFKLGDHAGVTTWGAGGWDNVALRQRIEKLIIPDLRIDPVHLASLVHDILVLETQYYAGLWYKNLAEAEIKFNEYYNGYENKIHMQLYVDGNLWCQAEIKPIKYIENTLTFINLKDKAFYDFRQNT